MGSKFVTIVTMTKAQKSKKPDNSGSLAIKYGLLLNYFKVEGQTYSVLGTSVSAIALKPPAISTML